ncbi:hypothetical protein LEP1GSC068_2833 [Leptospira sp. Fiocruz LV3954]|nr:hypothetical protein LEP1GSC068_2833 [Leptospira sp. Fiocruz LV3954]EMI60360.1 hypothetical protein LEP1GSC076_4086 [Leptospira sp. Fiocruz LV4135]
MGGDTSPLEKGKVMVFRSILKISNSGNSFFGRKEVLGLEQDSFFCSFFFSQSNFYFYLG